MTASSLGLWSTGRALDQRNTASAARDLQVAAIRVAAADAVRLAGGNSTDPALDGSVQTLQEDHGRVLAALSPTDADATERLLIEIAGCGSWLLDPGDEAHEVHGHTELQSLLNTAADNAGNNATSAERTAVWALFGVVIAIGFGAAVAIRRRFRTQRARVLALSQERAGKKFAALVHDSPDVFIVINADGVITYRSDSATRLLPADAATRDDLVSLACADDAAELESHLRRADAGGACATFELLDPVDDLGWFELRVSDLTDDAAVAGHVVTARDITSEIRLRDELRHQVATDPLTGIANRRMLEVRLAQIERSMRTSPLMMAVVLIDIDGFKGVNDSLGHEAGDELLTLVVGRLKTTLTNDDLLLRLGGDEFALLITRVGDEIEATRRANEMMALFVEPFRIGGHVECVRASAGVAVADSPAGIANVISNADIALYAAKRHGGDKAVLHDLALEESAARATRVRRALLAADFDGEFSIAYQPIVPVDGGRIVGLEALLRWTSPTVGSVGPDEFIPIAEVSGDIDRIGLWVIDSVCRQLSAWTGPEFATDFTVSFNVSPLQLAHDDFVATVMTATESWGVSPRRLVVEVTESVALDQSGTAVERLDELRAAGFAIAIDDFGSGHSNLGQLLRVPFDVLKIDRSLLLMLTARREDDGGEAIGACKIMESIVSIAAILGAPVVCEGVETEDQRTSLAASGVTFVQGYLTGRPAPPREITDLLSAAAILDLDERELSEIAAR